MGKEESGKTDNGGTASTPTADSSARTTTGSAAAVDLARVIAGEKRMSSKELARQLFDSGYSAEEVTQAIKVVLSISPV